MPKQSSGTIYMVGTPIGNLEDLTFRAKRILATVNLIACEDTRVTRKLLDHYAITTPTTSIHHHSTAADLDRALDQVERGQDVAVVTDAGMPGISDPGGKLLARAVERGLRVESVPGPSALTTAASLSGVPTDTFLFLGFLPHKKGRETLFRRIAEATETVVCYESPHRLLKTLTSFVAHEYTKHVVVCRELTKIHESVVRGTAAEVLAYFTAHPDEVRGEVVILVH